jgi:hypothetical protein
MKTEKRRFDGLRKLVLAAVALLTLSTAVPLSASMPKDETPSQTAVSRLSPYWGPAIQQWEHEIAVLADTYGFDPDFIAAVIMEESNGNHGGVSRVGAVGLMGVMPTSPGLEWRPSTEELLTPTTNLRWGTAILAEIVRQSGGDLFSALAAYSGGWDEANSRIPRQYAASVLDNYGRAIISRIGMSPDIATQWTIAIQIKSGNVPVEDLLVLGSQPVSGLKLYGEHVIFDYVDQFGRPYYVKGYAVPVALTVPAGLDDEQFGSPNSVEPQLRARLGEDGVKLANSNSHVLLACLPSLSRLRGRVSTRWFAPSSCPSWHR